MDPLYLIISLCLRLETGTDPGTIIVIVVLLREFLGFSDTPEVLNGGSENLHSLNAFHGWQ